MLLRTSVTNAQHMLFTVRCCMGQDQAARLLQKRPYLLFIPHATVHLAEQAERIAAAYGISKVRPIRSRTKASKICGCIRMYW
jgi:hypothetical protein